MSEKEEAAPKKKGKLVKIVGLVLGIGVLVGGGVGAGLYAASSGMIGGGAHAEAKEDPNKPHLVPKSAQKRAGEGGGEGEGGHGGGGGEEAAGASHGGIPTPESMAGDKFASNYYPMEKEFTSNLQDSTHFVQVGVAISTPYDDKVIEHLKTNDIAIRSAILMTLGDTTEEQVFTSQGKQQLARKLVAAINGVLEQKEGFGGVSNVYFTNFVVQ
ncbi:flagellar basal body-associated FliL family protein [Sphingomonas sp. RHCKR47]|uniref:flagellar basal body-associated FliL family protein n=1 Tax=Sphingomonas citricola TaxID=2862498 RepID=UPI001C67B519|nr:flagellar basal body-associated FliL family protein [Sphingomonas citricola]MBW6524088.1 flagellar basal body-associated FliL family protein [Sphingomonas citricola]